ncbi:NAD-binding protein [Escherichia coli]
MGYGRVGSLLGEKLLASDIPLVVIETSRTRVDELRERGAPCCIGQCSERRNYATGASGRGRLILLFPNGYEAGEIVAAACENPDIEIIARAHYDGHEADAYHRTWRNQVVMGEREIARTMLESPNATGR